ncbi:hypothetical protein D9611_014527 [Ephemerocybe angulata]|uniref:Uncharacterized protein n=1 Tax=Ephemerocybe angulata TaxID=980116 RepID=A0A8H5CA23_9AGAR|nr:hypothetical protein D9611_014527 [Tulosesus angulatus]
MVQSYLRHGPTQAFGLVCSATSNAVFDGKLAYVPALEDVLVWDVKKGEMRSMWHETGHRSEVTCILRSPQPNFFAVGYADGSIRLWDSTNETVVTVFNGHKKSVTALAFDDRGTRLASGSQDTDLIVWDIVAEAGLYRLRGHRDQITGIKFLSTDESQPSSKTAAPGLSPHLFKRYLLKTLGPHNAPLHPDSRFDLTGSGEGEVKAWRIDRDAVKDGLKETESGEIAKIHPITNLPLGSNHRVSQISFHPKQPYVAFQSHDKSIEIFRIRDDEEVKKKLARRRKRAKEKKQEKGDKKGPEITAMEIDQDDEEVPFIDKFTPHVVVRASGKVRSFNFANETTSQKNIAELMWLFLTTPSRSTTFRSPQNLQKHPQRPRATILYPSLDIAQTLLHVFGLWTAPTLCARLSFPETDMLLLAPRPRDSNFRCFIIFSHRDCQSHTGTVWSLHVRKDGRALVSGSADKEVKFWDFEEKEGNEEISGRLLSLVHVRTLKMTDVLSVRYSPDGKFLAVALLDSTVKVFYQDSLKFFLSLYGHKLPVLDMDISDDSKLIVTCSADKNVKIWGLDFGDCHKSIFAHEDSVMQVKFEKDSHYFWTVGKDKMLKYWDGDKHSLKASRNLKVTTERSGAGSESFRKLRRHWVSRQVDSSVGEARRTKEREKELEKLDAPIGSGVEGAPAGEEAEVSAVTKQTAETLMAGEKIMEALDLADQEMEAFKEYYEAMAKLAEDDALRMQPPPRNPVLAAYDLEPDAYVLRVVEGPEHSPS